MKPPKPIRGVVNTLFGINTKKQRDSDVPQPNPVPTRPSYDDMEVIDRRRSHREELRFQPQHTQTLPRRTTSYGADMPNASTKMDLERRQSSLPRRTKSYGTDSTPIVHEPMDRRIESRLTSQTTVSPPIQFQNHKRVEQNTFADNAVRASSLPNHSAADPVPCFNRRSVSSSSAQAKHRSRPHELILDDYDEKINFTNSSTTNKTQSSTSIKKHSTDTNTRLVSKNEINNNIELPTIKHTSKESTEKLVSCLDALDRLSQQVKRINAVSEKVKRVEKYSQHDPKKERHLRELNIAAQASMRIKSLIRSEFDRAEDNSRHSSQSSGYSSDSSRRQSSSPTDPPSRSSLDRLYKDINQNTLPPIRRSHNEMHYPQSVQDMMPIWDEKRKTHVSYDGSVSSGYMTGSSSEEEQRTSPPMSHGYPNRYPSSQQWHQQQRYQAGYYPSYEYDPNYEYYGMYGQYDGSEKGMTEEEMYGYYGYASSSIQDGDLYAGNGWYKLPSAAGQHPQSRLQEQEYQRYQHSWRGDSQAPHGNLGEIFYDPRSNMSTPLMQQPSPDDVSSMNSFSFGGSNTMRSMPSTNTSKTSKKTVRFSQTVRKRVETEESELEDSTGVIKACRDEGNDKILTKKDLEQQQFDNQQSQYYWQRGGPHTQQQIIYY